MSRFLITVFSAIAALAIVVASGAAQVPRVPSLPPGWSHAEINVVIKGQPHTLVYDRGQVQAVTASSIVLRERDGSIQTIAVSPTATITINGANSTLSQVVPRETATTVAVDGGAAASVKVQLSPALAAQLARQQARAAAQQLRQQKRR